MIEKTKGSTFLVGWLKNLSKLIALFFTKHSQTDAGLLLQAVASFIEVHASEGAFFFNV